jgi:polysaccharide pyruvyl transferase WcaK-like protein
MPTAVLAGAFGQRNPGDDALLDAFAAALPEWDLVATCSAPRRGGGPEGCTRVDARDPGSVLRAVARADAVVFAGGTVFKTLSPATGRPPHDLLSRALALAAGTRALRKPLAMVGVGAGALPGRRARRLARRLVRQADLLVLRDEESASVLAAAGAQAPFRIGADPAWTVLERGRALDGALPALERGSALDPASPVMNRAQALDGALQVPAGDHVAVALSHHAGGAELPDRLAAMLFPVHAAGLRVRLVPWQVGTPCRDDLDVARAVAARLGGNTEIVVPPADLVAGRDALAGARLVLGLRFHALMAAAAAGVPFVAYAHEAKLAGLARRLGQPTIEPSLEPMAAGQVLLAALDDARPPRASALRAEVGAAEESLRLLRLLLARGRSEEAASVTGLTLEPVPWLT